MWKYLRGESDEDVEKHKTNADELLQKIEQLKKDHPELTAYESRLKQIKSRSKAYVFGPEKRNNELEKIKNQIEQIEAAKQIEKKTPKQSKLTASIFDKLSSDSKETTRLTDEFFALLQSDFGATEKYPNLKSELEQFVKDNLRSPAMIQKYIDFLKSGKTSDEHFLIGSNKFKLPKPPVDRTRTCYNLSEPQKNYIKKNLNLDPLTVGGTKKNKHAARPSAHGRLRRGPTPRRARSRRSAALRHRASRRAQVR